MPTLAVQTMTFATAVISSRFKTSVTWARLPSFLYMDAGRLDKHVLGLPSLAVPKEVW